MIQSYKLSFGKIKNKICSKLSKDLIYGMLVKGVIIISQLLIIPIYISELGQEVYGEWIMITVIPNYLILSDLGLTTTVSNQISYYNVLKNYGKMIGLFKSTNFLIIIIGLTILLFFVISLYYIDYHSLLNIYIIDREKVSLILLFFIINIVATLLLNFNLSYFRSIDKYYMNQKYVFVSYCIDLIITLIVLKTSKNLILIPVLFTFSKIFLLFVTIFKLSKYENYEYGFSKNIREVKKILPSSLSYSLYSIGFGLILQGNTFIVGKVLGTNSVVIFNTVRTLVNTMRSFMSIIYLPKMPKYNILLSSERISEAKVVFKKNLQQVIILTLLSGLFITLFYKTLLYYWIHKELVITKTFIFLMIFGAVLHTIWNAVSMVTLSINKTFQLLLFPAMGVVSILIQYFYLNTFGLELASFFLLIIDLIMLVTVFVKTNKIIKLY